MSNGDGCCADSGWYGKSCDCKTKVSDSPEFAGYAINADINHVNTMVVATNKAEFAYILAWCDIKDVQPPWLGERNDFPVALSVNGGGWTADMDRAVYYMKVDDFISQA